VEGQPLADLVGQSPTLRMARETWRPLAPNALMVGLRPSAECNSAPPCLWRVSLWLTWSGRARPSVSRAKPGAPWRPAASWWACGPPRSATPRPHSALFLEGQPLADLVGQSPTLRIARETWRPLAPNALMVGLRPSAACNVSEGSRTSFGPRAYSPHPHLTVSQPPTTCGPAAHRGVQLRAPSPPRPQNAPRAPRAPIQHLTPEPAT